MQHLVTAELRDVHVARIRFYADDQLEIISELLKVFQQLENKAEYHIWTISAIKRATSGDKLVGMVAWEGLEEADSTWEPVSPRRAGRAAQRAQGAVAEGGAEADALAVVCVAFVIIL